MRVMYYRDRMRKAETLLRFTSSAGCTDGEVASARRAIKRLVGVNAMSFNGSRRECVADAAKWLSMQ